jgi:hypothetical protein
LGLKGKWKIIQKKEGHGLSSMDFGFIFAVPFGKRLERKMWNGDKKVKFIDRMDRAHNLDLRKIEMMKLGKKSEAFLECWKG